MFQGDQGVLPSQIPDAYPGCCMLQNIDTKVKLVELKVNTWAVLA
jgi:hypothetical protein